jgi:hypothetical protein
MAAHLANDFREQLGFEPERFAVLIGRDGVKT